MKVDVYWNLHKKTFSVRNRQTGLVELHSDLVEVFDATFVVQPAGREKVLETGRKNVHAFVRGVLGGFIPENDVDYWLPNEAKYNPFKRGTFVDAETGKPMLDEVELVLCVKQHGKGKVYYE